MNAKEIFNNFDMQLTEKIGYLLMTDRNNKNTPVVRIELRHNLWHFYFIEKGKFKSKNFLHSGEWVTLCHDKKLKTCPAIHAAAPARSFHERHSKAIDFAKVRLAEYLAEKHCNLISNVTVSLKGPDGKDSFVATLEEEGA